MLQHAKEIDLIPEEQIADKGKTAEDGVFIKVLKSDYSRLRGQPFAEISAEDAANCYDLVNHLILAMLLKAIGMPTGPIIVMLSTIKGMKYYLRMGFGKSKRYMGEDLARRMHGLNQGSKAALQNWLLISSILVKMQRARGHVAKVITPITKVISTIVGSLYVDDTILFVLREDILTRGDLLNEAQAALTDWGGSLIASGGSCKSIKCWAYLVDYNWDDQGQWYCESMVDGYSMTVPTHDGPGKIDLLPSDSCKETLGVFTSPSGSSNGHFMKIADKIKL